MGYALLAHTVAVQSGGTGVTTSAIDTTGADFIHVTLIDWLFKSGPSTLSDSKGNTWSQLTSRAAVAQTHTYYCQGGTVGTGHTFTISGFADTYGTIIVAAFSGSVSTPADQENGTFTISAPVTSMQPGSVTPSEANELIMVGAAFVSDGEPSSPSVNSGFTIIETNTKVSGTWGYILAYLVQGLAAAINPTVSWGNNSDVSIEISSFKGTAPSGGGGKPANYYAQQRRQAA